MIKKLDLAAQRFLKLPYLQLTREYLIHDRCRFLLSELAAMPWPASFLDVGCGSGVALHYLRQAGKPISYVGVDRDASRLRRRFPPGDIRFVDLDLDRDWDLGQFDVARCSEVLEHLFDDASLFARIARSVRAGGTIILTMPSAAFVDAMGVHVPAILELSDTQDGGHVRRGYTPRSIRELLPGTGCEIVRVGAISKSSVAEMRVRYEATAAVRALHNLRYLGRPERDAFVRDIGEHDELLKDYHGIAAVLRRN